MRNPAANLLFLAAAALSASSPGLVLADVPIQNNITTTNWSGFGAIVPSSGSHAYTSVSGSWVVPTLTPTVADTYSGIWVGLDGLNSQTVEQIGILANYVGGSPEYYAFYELYPQDSLAIYNVGGVPFTISPGDSMSALVAYAGSSGGRDQFLMTLADLTTGLTYSSTNSSSASGDLRSSAEWIVEAPTVGGSTARIAKFGSLTFTDCSASLDGLASSPISAFPNSGIDLVPAGGGRGAVTSPLDPSGTSFTVTVVSPAPEPSFLALAAFTGLLLRRRR